MLHYFENQLNTMFPVVCYCTALLSLYRLRSVSPRVDEPSTHWMSSTQSSIRCLPSWLYDHLFYQNTIIDMLIQLPTIQIREAKLIVVKCSCSRTSAMVEVNSVYRIYIWLFIHLNLRVNIICVTLYKCPLKGLHICFRITPTSPNYFERWLI